MNNIERGALVFTFGYDVGEYLANRINIEFPDGFTKDGSVPTDDLEGKRNVNEIHLHTDYDLRTKHRLYWLGLFIHEATHVWQKNTGRHRGGKGGEDYNYNVSQLASRDLKKRRNTHRRCKIGLLQAMVFQRIYFRLMAGFLEADIRIQTSSDGRMFGVTLWVVPVLVAQETSPKI